MTMPRHFLLFISVSASWACGTAKLSGYDCPLASQLRAGVTISCGSQTVVGAVVGSDLPQCDAQIRVGCVANKSYLATDLSRLTGNNIKNGHTVLGVVGTLKTKLIGGTFPLCAEDGQRSCIVADQLVAIDTDGLAERIAAGTSAGGVAGTGGIKAAVVCSSNAQVGCLSGSVYPAYNQAFVSSCLSLDP